MPLVCLVPHGRTLPPPTLAKYFSKSFFEGIIIDESASLESGMKDKDLQNGWNTDGDSNACT